MSGHEVVPCKVQGCKGCDEPCDTCHHDLCVRSCEFAASNGYFLHECENGCDVSGCTNCLPNHKFLECEYCNFYSCADCALPSTPKFPCTTSTHEAHAAGSPRQFFVCGEPDCGFAICEPCWYAEFQAEHETIAQCDRCKKMVCEHCKPSFMSSFKSVLPGCYSCPRSFCEDCIAQNTIVCRKANCTCDPPCVCDVVCLDCRDDRCRRCGNMLSRQEQISLRLRKKALARERLALTGGTPPAIAAAGTGPGGGAVSAPPKPETRIRKKKTTKPAKPKATTTEQERLALQAAMELIQEEIQEQEEAQRKKERQHARQERKRQRKLAKKQKEDEPPAPAPETKPGGKQAQAAPAPKKGKKRVGSKPSGAKPKANGHPPASTKGHTHVVTDEICQSSDKKQPIVSPEEAEAQRVLADAVNGSDLDRLSRAIDSATKHGINVHSAQKHLKRLARAKSLTALLEQAIDLNTEFDLADAVQAALDAPNRVQKMVTEKLEQAQLLLAKLRVRPEPIGVEDQSKVVEVAKPTPPVEAPRPPAPSKAPPAAAMPVATVQAPPSRTVKSAAQAGVAAAARAPAPSAAPRPALSQPSAGRSASVPSQPVDRPSQQPAPHQTPHPQPQAPPHHPPVPPHQHPVPQQFPPQPRYPQHAPLPPHQHHPQAPQPHYQHQPGFQGNGTPLGYGLPSAASSPAKLFPTATATDPVANAAALGITASLATLGLNGPGELPHPGLPQHHQHHAQHQQRHLQQAPQHLRQPPPPQQQLLHQQLLHQQQQQQQQQPLHRQPPQQVYQQRRQQGDAGLAVGSLDSAGAFAVGLGLGPGPNLGGGPDANSNLMRGSSQAFRGLPSGASSSVVGAPSLNALGPNRRPQRVEAPGTTSASSGDSGLGIWGSSPSPLGFSLSSDLGLGPTLGGSASSAGLDSLFGGDDANSMVTRSSTATATGSTGGRPSALSDIWGTPQLGSQLGSRLGADPPATDAFGGMFGSFGGAFDSSNSNGGLGGLAGLADLSSSLINDLNSTTTGHGRGSSSSSSELPNSGLPTGLPTPRLSGRCSLCLSRPADLVCAPCGCACVCSSCYKTASQPIDSCPRCQTAIKHFSRKPVQAQ